MTLRRSIPFLVLLGALPASGQVFDERFDAWPERTRIGGAIGVAFATPTADQLKNVLRRITADTTIGFLLSADLNVSVATQMQSAFEDSITTVSVFHDSESLAQSLPPEKEWPDLTVVHSGDLLPTDDQEFTEIKRKLSSYVDQGGHLVLVGSIAKLAGLKWVNNGSALTDGLNLLPMGILCHKERLDLAKVRAQLTRHPRSVGIALSQNALLLLKNRTVRILGEGSATFTLVEGPFHAAREQTLKERQSGQRAPRYLVDWTEWRRDSIDRTLPMFPPARPRQPNVKAGSLLIVGGGGMPRGLMSRFVELAGGTEEARLVYVPCSEDIQVSPRQSMVQTWKRMGVRHATFIHTKDRNTSNEDPAFLKPLKDATGIWFGGGRQWNMADSYYGTSAHRLMKEVLARGGVIGGSSAGASIQARYLARATPIENFRIMAPGYERGGLGFISGVAIDQHFSQRGRQKDMTQLVNRYPQLLGIGLDEATAIEVQKTEATVVGRGEVFFYDRNSQSSTDDPDYLALPAGSKFDLATRKILVDSRDKAEDTGEDAGNDDE